MQYFKTKLFYMSFSLKQYFYTYSYFIRHAEYYLLIMARQVFIINYTTQFNVFVYSNNLPYRKGVATAFTRGGGLILWEGKGKGGGELKNLLESFWPLLTTTYNLHYVDKNECGILYETIINSLAGGEGVWPPNPPLPPTNPPPYIRPCRSVVHNIWTYFVC